ncbi:MAG TPA: transketolase C-terminal domain-containing protein, partial [Clostridia bacterium]|nr:transketolase C-terminal domain-containing protein [Clostridia bacterium]
YGPVDGHNLPDLERHLKALRMVRGPVLFHVITVKGKGYSYAEDEPEFYHGVSPFDTANGQSAAHGSGKTFSTVFGETMIELAGLDPDIVAITAAMAQGTGLIRFQSVFPDRFRDVGIAEQHAVTMAAGMAAGGLRPFVAMYSTFIQRAIDQLLHDVCLQNLPVVFAVDRAGLVGGDGDTHQGVYDLSIALSLPNLTVAAPATVEDLRALLFFARRHDGPILIRYPHAVAPERDPLAPSLDLNHASLADIAELRPIRTGKDLTVVVLGAMLEEATLAVDRLVARFPGRSVDLLSCIIASPFDYENMLISIQKTGSLLVIEEGVEEGGFGSLIVAQAQKRYPGLKADFAGVTGPTAGQATRVELKADEALDAVGLEGRMLGLMGVIEQPLP